MLDMLGRALCAVVLSAIAAADVIHVGLGPIPTVQDGLAVAQDGDILLVHASTPGFTVAGQSVVIVAAQPAVWITGQVVVRELGRDQSVTLQGFRIEPFEEGICVDAVANQGAVWLEDCEVVATGTFQWYGAVRATRCERLVVRDCTIRGGDACCASAAGMRGLDLVRSRAFVFDSTLTGGDGRDGLVGAGCSGQAGSGGDAVHAEASELLLVRCFGVGGDGGDGQWCAFTGCEAGGDAGHGVKGVDGSKVVLVANHLVGGEAGYGGAFFAGTCPPGSWGVAVSMQGGSVETPGGPARTLDTTSPVTEGVTTSAWVRGAPGELVALYGSLDVAEVELPSLVGVLLLEPPPVLLASGVLPASGLLELPFVPHLGGNVEGVAVRLQVVTLPPTGGFVLGEPATVVVLDG